MKHIVVAVTNDLTYDQRMLRTAETLVEEGYEVTLIGRSLEGSVKLSNRPYKQVRLKCHVNTGPLFYAEYNRKLLRYLHSMDFDLAVACDLDTILAVTRAAKSKDRPFVFDSHELFTEVPELDGRGLVKSVWSRIGKMCVPSAARCYTVGNAIAGELSKEYNRKFEVVRNVPSLSHESLKEFEERDPVLLYQGALNEGRGLELLIDCMADIDGYQLVLAGEGDLSQALRNRAKERGLGDKVKFLGRIDPARLPALTASVRVGINLLEARSKSYYFSLANKFFDYMQAGTPSINMDFPEYRAILDRNPTGLMIDTLSKDKLSNAIINLTRDLELWTRLSQHCLEAREIYCWENERDLLSKMYNEAISS